MKKPEPKLGSKWDRMTNAEQQAAVKKRIQEIEAKMFAGHREIERLIRESYESGERVKPVLKAKTRRRKKH